jgi:hypothetical protein
MGVRLGVVLSLVALLACTLAAAAAAGLQSPRRAELNLLRAPRMLARWDTSFTDPRTRLVRPTTIVVCRGVGKARAHRYARLRCTIRSPRVRVTVAYRSLGRYGFTAHRLTKRKLG